MGAVYCRPTIILSVQRRTEEQHQQQQQQASVCLCLSVSLSLSLSLHEMPIFGHFAMKACFAIHSFLVPNNGLQANGLSLLCGCSPDQQCRSEMEQKEGERMKMLILWVVQRPKEAS